MVDTLYIAQNSTTSSAFDQEVYVVVVGLPLHVVTHGHSLAVGAAKV